MPSDRVLWNWGRGGGEVLDFPTQLGRKSKGDKKGTSKGCVEFYRSNDFCSVLHPLDYFALNIHDLFYMDFRQNIMHNIH